MWRRSWSWSSKGSYEVRRAHRASSPTAEIWSHVSWWPFTESSNCNTTSSSCYPTYHSYEQHILSTNFETADSISDFFFQRLDTRNQEARGRLQDVRYSVLCNAASNLHSMQTEQPDAGARFDVVLESLERPTGIKRTFPPHIRWKASVALGCR